MKKLFLIFIALFPAVIYGQTFIESDEMSTRNDRAYEVVGRLKDRILLFRDRDSKYEVQAFNEQMRFSWNKELDITKKHSKVIGVLRGKEDFSLFFTYKKKGKFWLRVHRYDPGANLIDSTTLWHYPSRFYPPKPSMLTSENKKKVLFYQLEKGENLECMVFDVEQMELQWFNKIVLQKFNNFEDQQHWVLNNNGEAFLFIEKNNRKNAKTAHFYEMYCFNENNEGESLQIPMEEMMTYDVQFEFDNLNNVIVAGGLYSDKNRGRANGTFYMNMTNEKPYDYLLKFQAFENDFMAKVMEKRKGQTVKGLTDVDIRDIVIRKDGGVLMFTERSKLYERRMASAGRGYIGRDGSRYIVDYYFDDVFITAMHPHGEIHWKTILHKRQYSQDDEAVYSSYFLLKTPSTLRLFFNDEIRSENTVSEYVLRTDGNFDRHSVMSTKDRNVQLRFRDGIQTKSNEFIIPSERRNKLKLIKMEY